MNVEQMLKYLLNNQFRKVREAARMKEILSNQNLD